MKIEFDENLIRCIVGANDVHDLHMSQKDFTYMSNKTQQFLYNILKVVKEKFGLVIQGWGAINIKFGDSKHKYVVEISFDDFFYMDDKEYEPVSDIQVKCTYNGDFIPVEGASGKKGEYNDDKCIYLLKYHTIHDVIADCENMCLEKDDKCVLYKKGKYYFFYIETAGGKECIPEKPCIKTTYATKEHLDEMYNLICNDVRVLLD